MTAMMSDEATRSSVDYLSDDRMPASKGEVPSLDGLRAVSILIVMMGHFIDNRFPGGLGVLVFFVISGFLITRLLLTEAITSGTIDLKNFYIRRFLRLYPVIVALNIVVVLVAFAKGREFDVLEPLSTLFYFANYYYSWLFSIGQKESLPLGIFWSLSVEEHFYFLFPGLLLLLRADARRLAAAMLAVLIGCLLLRLTVAHYNPSSIMGYSFYFRTEYRLDSLAIGVLMAALCELPVGRRFLKAMSHPAAVLGSLALLGLCLGLRDLWFRETIRYSLLGIAISGLIAAVLFSPRYWPAIAVLNTPVFRLIGRLSYSLYVWHLTVAFALGTHSYSLPAKLALEFGGTFFVAAISYYGIERPFLTLRRRFGSEARA